MKQIPISQFRSDCNSILAELRRRGEPQGAPVTNCYIVQGTAIVAPGSALRHHYDWKSRCYDLVGRSM